VYWSRWLEVTKGTTEATAVELKAELSLGMIEEVKIFFPPGCLGYVKCKLFHWEDQILPRHPQGYIAGDDYPFVFPMDHPIEHRPALVTVKAWNTATTYDHSIMIGIFLRETVRGRITRAVQTVFGIAD